MLLELAAIATDKDGDLIERIRAAHHARLEAEKIYRELCRINRKRLDTDRLIAEYIAKGGEIKIVPMGVSGLDSEPVPAKVNTKKRNKFVASVAIAAKAKAEVFTW